MNKGSRNLLLLGIIIIAFALINTIFSVAIYHYSGDIYLDRSRPGFLPDEDEPGISIGDYDFPEMGTFTNDDLDDYLKHYNAEIDYLESFSATFAADPLSNEALGIPEN